VKLLAGLFSAGESASYALGAGRHAWLHVARGKVRCERPELSAGDAVQASEEAALELTACKTRKCCCSILA